MWIIKNIIFSIQINFDEIVKNPNSVMPDLIRHPEASGITGL
jgi:hypothetical protein